jgi:hypothetical protein
MSDTPREGQHPAKDLVGLAKRIEAFMEANDTSAVLLDRSDVLLSTAGLDALIMLVHRLNEVLEICKSCVLVQMDTQAVRETDLRALRRELTKY